MILKGYVAKHINQNSFELINRAFWHRMTFIMAFRLFRTDNKALQELYELETLLEKLGI